MSKPFPEEYRSLVVEDARAHPPLCADDLIARLPAYQGRTPSRQLVLRWLRQAGVLTRRQILRRDGWSEDYKREAVAMADAGESAYRIRELLLARDGMAPEVKRIKDWVDGIERPASSRAPQPKCSGDIWESAWREAEQACKPDTPQWIQDQALLSAWLGKGVVMYGPHETARYLAGARKRKNKKHDADGDGAAWRAAA